MSNRDKIHPVVEAAEGKVRQAQHNDLLHRLSVLRGWADNLSSEILKLESDIRERSHTGCGRLPGEEDAGPCNICRRSVDDCICAECPVCGTAGKLACYVSEWRGGHNMVLTIEQVISRHEGEIYLRREAFNDEIANLAENVDRLKAHPERIERGLETENLLRSQLRGYPKDYRPKKKSATHEKPGATG